MIDDSPIQRTVATVRRYLLLGLLFTLAFAAPTAAQSGARQVLLLNSFEGGSAVQNIFAGRFRTELGSQSPVPLNIFEVSLQPLFTQEHPPEASVVDYLQSTFGGQHLDLVVTIGGPAAAFARKHRDQLFPSTPFLLTAFDQRAADVASSPNEAAIPVVTDPPKVVDEILHLLPETRTIFVVIGGSRIEQFWRGQLTGLFQPFQDRVTFLWSDGLSFADTLKRAGSLPPHSAILHTLYSVDGKGVIQSEERSLAELHAVANAPLFGLYDFQLGRGVVGGSLISIGDLVGESARVALRLLSGEQASTIQISPQSPTPPTFDWRELQRWGISEARLPAASIVQFRQPTAWDQYKAYIIGIVALVGLQSALIAGLIVQRSRRRRTEVALRQSEQQYRSVAEQNQDLAGRLITAQEAERTRIARDLHDDVSQQLAGLSIAFSGLKRRLANTEVGSDLQEELTRFQQQTLGLARNVRHLSHDLHPTVLQHLGLVKALTSYCAELERAHGVAIKCSTEGSFASISPDAALCVYRIAQEALRNVIAHAAASRADVRLVQIGDRVEMTITDDGRGFDTTNPAGRSKGLGLVSITERAKIAGGTISITSGVGHGTRIEAILPVNATATNSKARGPALTMR